MGLHHRKLLSDCEYFCHSEQLCASNCDDCLNECYNPSPPSHNNISNYLIISFSIVAAVFLLLCSYTVYVKFFRSNRRRTTLLLSNQQTQDGDFVVVDDEDQQHHGPMVDHPIWYIRTPGLQQSIISAITVVKYKKGEGLIEGTDCSVCLSEFQEDESLRLLPKCNHAFHLPCIDTWLRSHTNCPLCRAPIIVITNQPSRIPSMEPNNNSVFGESARIMQVLENGTGETETETSGDGGMEDDGGIVAQLRNGEEEPVEEYGRRRWVCEGESESESSGLEEVVNNNMKPRRSVSLDSSSAAKINLALSSTVVVKESHHHGRKLSEQIVSKRVVGGNGNSDSSSSLKRSRSFNGKHLLSWYSRSQKKSNGPLRSF